MISPSSVSEIQYNPNTIFIKMWTGDHFWREKYSSCGSMYWNCILHFWTFFVRNTGQGSTMEGGRVMVNGGGMGPFPPSAPSPATIPASFLSSNYTCANLQVFHQWCIQRGCCNSAPDSGRKCFWSANKPVINRPTGWHLTVRLWLREWNTWPCSDINQPAMIMNSGNKLIT